MTWSDRPQTLAWVAVALIATLAFVARWRYLATSPWPLGIDGFYYAVQMRSLLTDHRLYYDASPMVFWLAIPATWMMGPIAGVQMTAAIGTSLATVPVYAIVSRATGQRAAGVLAAAIIATSAGGFYLTTEFVKQGVGLTIALGFVAALGALLDAQEPRSRRRWMIATAVLLVATLLSHLTSVGIAVAFGLPPLWVALTRGDAIARRRAILMVAAGVVALGALIVLLVPTIRQGMGLANLFGPASLRFTGEHYTFRHEVASALIAACALVLALIATRRTPTISAAARALLVGPAVLAFLLALPWLSVADSQGLAYRLRVMAFVPFAICAGAAPAVLLSRFAPRLQQFVPIAAAAMILAFVPLRYTKAVQWPNAHHIPALKEIASHTPKDAIVLVSNRQLGFMIKWFADREARVRPPRTPGERPLFRLADPLVMPAPLFKDFATLQARLPAAVPRPVRLTPERRTLLYLFPEATWQALLRVVSAEDRAQMEPWPGR